MHFHNALLSHSYITSQKHAFSDWRIKCTNTIEQIIISFLIIFGRFENFCFKKSTLLNRSCEKWEQLLKHKVLCTMRMWTFPPCDFCGVNNLCNRKYEIISDWLTVEVTINNYSSPFSYSNILGHPNTIPKKGNLNRRVASKMSIMVG